MDKTKAPACGARGKICAAGAAPRAARRKVKPDMPEEFQTASPNGATEEKSKGKAKSQEKLQADKSECITNQKNGRKVKPAEPSSEEMRGPQTVKDTTKAPPTTTKAKPRSIKENSKAKLAEENHETQQKDKNNAKLPAKNAKAKTDGRKPTSPESTETTTKDQPAETLQKTTATKKCAAKTKSVKSTEEPIDESKVTELEEEKAVDSVLKETLKMIKMKQKDISNNSEVVNETIAQIIKHLKNTTSFREVGEPLRTGSYYEKLKISSPDEFDVMIPMRTDRVEIEPFGDDGAFYSVAIKRGANPLKKFQGDEKLSASQMLSEFREEVKKCIKQFNGGKEQCKWEVTRKKPGCPAVTLTTDVESVTISLDVVLSLVVKSSWPTDTNDGLKIEDWLGTKVRKDYRLKPYYLVPKYEGQGTVEKDGVLAKDTWRISFSHVEKAILTNHGSEKTCCEKNGKNCCRKDCLKLLKKLLSLLKEADHSFNKFCSYQAKTTLLHACCSRTKDAEWKAEDLSRCFLQLLQDFEGHLERGELPNFFIPRQNLLSGPGKKQCQSLAARLKEERAAGFPIFKKQLSDPKLKF